MRVILRRRVLLLGSMTLTMVAIMLVLFQIPARYTAEATVMVYQRAEKDFDIDAVVSRLTADDQAVQSEIRVIQSHNLALRVVRRLGLTELEEFNPDLRVSLFDEVLESLDWPWLTAAFGPISLDETSEAERLERAEAVAARNFRKKLDVAVLGRSRVIAIAFTSIDPRLAARSANAVAEDYLELQVELKREATGEAANWLRLRLQTIRNEVETSERAVEDLRGQIIAKEGHDAGVLAQQVSELNTQLMLARGDLETTRARSTQIDSLVAEYGPTAIFEVTDPRVTLLMNEQLVRLRQTEANLRASHGDDNPIAAELDRQIRALQEQTAERLVAVARHDINMAELRVGALDAALKTLLGNSVEINQANVRLRSLEREAEANAELFQAYFVQLRQMVQEGFERADAVVVSRATSPIDPSSLGKTMFLIIAFGGALVTGLILVFIAEELETGYRDAEQLADDTGLFVLASIPLIRGRHKRREPADHVLDEPTGGFAESLRSLETALAMLPGTAPDTANVIQFTSAEAGEGKTSIVSALARVMARSGARVVAVDLDLRKSRLHTVFGLERGQGTVDYLSGNAELDQIISPDPHSDADVITAGTGSDDPLRLLRSPRAKNLVDALRERYDVVLVDTPPVLAVADSRVIGLLADHCVLVVGWARTRRDALRGCHQQLAAAKAPISGTVLSQVRGHIGARYGYQHYYN